MPVRKNKWKEYIIEVLMISLSVFLAFLVEEYRENLSEKKKTREILTRIKEELELNKNGIEKEIKYHKKVQANIEKEFLSGSYKKTLIGEMGFNMSALMPNGLMQFLPTDTAWDIAKSSDISTKIDHQLMKELNEVYNTQRVLIEQVKKTFELVTKQEFHKRENIKESLIVFAISFGDVLGKEPVLIQSYEKCIKLIDQELKK